MTATRRDLERALRTHAQSIAQADQKLAQLLKARNEVFRQLYVDHDLSMREIGEIVGLTSTAVMRNLRKSGVELGESKTKPGPKPANPQPNNS